MTHPASLHPDALTRLNRDATRRDALIEKLRQIANAKLGDPMPECLRAPTLIVGNVAEGEHVNIVLGANDWATPLSQIAGEAADALEIAARLQVLYDALMAGYDRLRADTDAAIRARLKGCAAEIDAEGRIVLVPVWQPIETAPVKPWTSDMACYYRFDCLLQNERGSVSQGWAYYVPPRRGSASPAKLRWADRHGQCFPILWMPLPAASSEHARSKP